MGSLETVLIIAAGLVLLSVVASRLSGRIGVPALLLFLVIGMLAGSEGPGGIEFDDPGLAQTVGMIALILILFAGGVDTDFAVIKPVIGRALLLSTAGVLITAALLGGFAILVADLPWRQGLLLGAIVASTDAAAVFAVLRSRDVRLRGDIRDLLEVESGSNDPMAVFLTVSLIALIQEPATTLSSFVASFVLQMVLGAILGVVFGWLAMRLMNRIRLDYDGLYSVLSVALMMLMFAGSNAIGGNGYLTVYIAGVTLGSGVLIHKNGLIRFHDGLAWLAQIAMFLTLGLLAFPSRILPVAGVGLAVAAFLMFVARPLAVQLLLLFSRFNMRARTLIGWVGLRGAVPIILATFPLVAGVDGAERIFNLVFFIVLASALVQGTTIAPAARWLHVEGPVYHVKAPVGGEEVDCCLLLEYEIDGAAKAAGRQIVEAKLPAGAHVTVIARGKAFLVPSGSSIIRAGDVLHVLADAEAHGVLADREGWQQVGAEA